MGGIPAREEERIAGGENGPIDRAGSDTFDRNQSIHSENSQGIGSCITSDGMILVHGDTSEEEQTLANLF